MNKLLILINGSLFIGSFIMMVSFPIDIESTIDMFSLIRQWGRDSNNKDDQWKWTSLVGQNELSKQKLIYCVALDYIIK